MAARKGKEAARASEPQQSAGPARLDITHVIASQDGIRAGEVDVLMIPEADWDLSPEAKQSDWSFVERFRGIACAVRIRF